MRIALYARVSTEEQALHGLSIEAQLAALRDFAKDQSVGEYVDAGISARVAIKKRPELQRLLRDVEAGRIDLVAFVKLDRWTRNIREYYKAQDVLDAHGVAWKALHEDYETQTAAGRLKVNIMLAVAQDEADRTSERVKAVFAEKRRKGLEVNGHMPPGLVYTDGVVTPGPDVERVRDLFNRYITTRSTNQTARESAAILGRPYSARGVQQILENEKYLTSGAIPARTWETVQAIRKERETRFVRTDRVYLFSGLLVCPDCGRKLTVRTRVWKGKPYVYYRCDYAQRMGACSWKKSVRENVLEQYLRDNILAAVAGHNLRISKKQKKPVNVPALQKKLDRLTDLYVEGSIEKEDYDRRAEPLRDQLKAARLTPQAVDTAEIRSALDTYTILSKAAQKAFWGLLVRRITPTETGFDVELFY